MSINETLIILFGAYPGKEQLFDLFNAGKMRLGHMAMYEGLLQKYDDV
jgi:hypothetical protein